MTSTYNVQVIKLNSLRIDPVVKVLIFPILILKDHKKLSYLVIFGKNYHFLQLSYSSYLALDILGSLRTNENSSQLLSFKPHLLLHIK